MKRCFSCMKEMQDDDEFCPFCGYKANSESLVGVHLIPGTILHDRYLVGMVIGHGGFGVTYVAWDEKKKRKVAIKEYIPSEFSSHMPGDSRLAIFGGEKKEQFEAGKKKFIDDARLLSKYEKEPGLVSVYDSFEENNTAYMVMEFLEGEKLSDYIEKRGAVSCNDAIDMLMPIMKSLMELHKVNLLHRDIAPDNIFITKEGAVKLIDFGAARYATTSHSRSLSVITKPGYSPQEQYMSRGDQGPHTDVYSLAATIYKMVTGETPPEAWNRRVKYENENKDILIEPHKISKKISKIQEIALLNAMNVEIDRRTPDIETFINELTSSKPIKRIQGKIKKLDFYSLPLWFKVAIPIISIAIITFISLIATNVISVDEIFDPFVKVPEGHVRVPDVIKKDKEEATSIIEGQNLIVYYGNSVETQYMESGTVISQDPVGERIIEIGSPVTLCVAYGRVKEAVDGKSLVPYLCEMSLEAAVANIEKAGLVYRQESTGYVYDDYVQEGLVCKQSIDYDTTVDEGTEIILEVSKGTEPFEMIDVVGKKYDDAEIMLAEKGLKAESNKVYGDNNAIGVVMAQSVAKGYKVQKGETVILDVCSGAKESNTNLISVPDVIGMTEKEAKQTLLNAGFSSINSVLSMDSDYDAGYVVSQSLQASTMQDKNSDITLVVSKGASEITVFFDANGGTVSSESRKVKVGGEYGELPEAYSDQLTFAGWFTDKSGGSQVYKSTRVGKDNVTLYAHWAKNSRNLIFDPNGGSVYQTTKSIEQGNAYGDLPVPIREYYTFAGWYDSAGKKADSNTIMGNKDVNLKAKWTEKSESDWVLEAEVPAGAKVIENKWTYIKTIWKTSDNPYEDGYIVDNSRTEKHEAEWGPWSDWSTNAVTEIPNKRQVEADIRTEKGPDEIVRYRMAEYNYRDSNKNRVYWPYEVNMSEYGYDTTYGHFGRQAWYSKEEVDACQKIPPGGYMGGANAGVNASGQMGYALRCDESWREIDYGRNTANTDTLIMFEVGSETKPTQVSITYYRYRDVNKDEYSTYYLYKKEQQESTTLIVPNDTISDVKHYVKFVEK